MATRGAELEQASPELRDHNRELWNMVQTYAEVIADLSAAASAPARHGLASITPIR